MKKLLLLFGILLLASCNNEMTDEVDSAYFYSPDAAERTVVTILISLDWQSAVAGRNPGVIIDLNTLWAPHTVLQEQIILDEMWIRTDNNKQLMLTATHDWPVGGPRQFYQYYPYINALPDTYGRFNDITFLSEFETGAKEFLLEDTYFNIYDKNGKYVRTINFYELEPNPSDQGQPLVFTTSTTTYNVYVEKVKLSR